MEGGGDHRASAIEDARGVRAALGRPLHVGHGPGKSPFHPASKALAPGRGPGGGEADPVKASLEDDAAHGFSELGSQPIFWAFSWAFSSVFSSVFSWVS
jgi:hypothetical protein